VNTVYKVTISDSNGQELCYVLVNDKKKAQEIEAKYIKFLKKRLKLHVVVERLMGVC